METMIKPLIESVTSTIPTGSHKLVLHNDEFNELTWVISCLIDVCNHSDTQAEQCATITHTKGHCDIKLGTQETLKQIKNELLQRSLTVTIELNS